MCVTPTPLLNRIGFRFSGFLTVKFRLSIFISGLCVVGSEYSFVGGYYTIVQTSATLRLQ